MKDYYRELGVSHQASQEEIKKAYRKLAKEYHPDVIKDDKAKQERMYRIQEAYACLKNQESREKYDRACLRSTRKDIDAGGKREKNSGIFEEREADRGQFERFFGFQPGKGMETYQDRHVKKPEGPIKPEEMFAAFFGAGSMQEAKRKNAPEKKS